MLKKKKHIFPGVPLPEVLVHWSGVALRCRDIASTPKVTAICSQDGEPFPRGIQLPVVTGYLNFHFFGKALSWIPFYQPKPLLTGSQAAPMLFPQSICTSLDLWGYLCGPGAWSLSAAPVNGSVFPLSYQPWVLTAIQIWHIGISHHPKFVSTLTGAASSLAREAVPWAPDASVKF